MRWSKPTQEVHPNPRIRLARFRPRGLKICVGIRADIRCTLQQTPQEKRLSTVNLRIASLVRLRSYVRCVAFATIGSFGFGTAAGGPPDTAPATAHESTTAVPTWLWGVWSRDWIQVGKVRTNTVNVHYLQTPTYFSDVRIPKDRPRFAGAASFRDLSDADLRLLAKQSGFTGSTTMIGAVATWHHDMQYQPPDGSEDTGRLQRMAKGRMQEHGLDGSYTEAWRSVTDGQRHFLVIRTLRFGRLFRVLVVVDDQFVYARNRATELPRAASLDALIESTHATREQIVEYLDCELSAGRVRGGSVPWAIEKSTLPWREGRHLDFIDEIATPDGGTALAPRKVGDEQWTTPINTLSRRELKALFGGEGTP
jgi:hypothetical protein